ncbi:MAG: potassium transporter TrkG [Acholeplasmataceae bacterium]
MKTRSPYLIIVSSFVLLIIIGTILLSLPISKIGNDITFINAFFLTTSAVTITGLSPVGSLLTSLSLFGKIVLMILIQLGGLSIITFSIFIIMLLGGKIGISERFLIKESLNQTSLRGLVKLVKQIVLTSFIIEGIGVIVNLFIFIPKMALKEAILVSVFHAVSAFNNAGFDILGNNSLINYSNNLLLNINTSILIMLGGLGFIVIFDLLKNKSFKKLSIHSKIVLKVNLILWIIAPLIFKLTNYNDITLMEAFFLSVTSRTAGFTSVNLNLISHASLLVVMVLMFIGASPSSTGGGIKTTTLYVLFKRIVGFASGKPLVVNKRLIEEKSVIRAFLLTILSASLIFLGTFLLLISEGSSLHQSLFEAVSAFGNVGLTLNLTQSLGVLSKIVLSIIMLIGRVGPLTFILMFNHNWYKEDIIKVDYLEEKVIIG